MKNNHEIYWEWIESTPLENEGDISLWNEYVDDDLYKIQYYFVVEADLVKSFEEWIKSCPFKVHSLDKDDGFDGDESYEYQCWFHIPNDGSFPENEEVDTDC